LVKEKWKKRKKYFIDIPLNKSFYRP